VGGDGGLELVAVVEQLGCTLSDEAVSPFLNPEYVGVMAGTVPPWFIVGLEAVMVSGTRLTVKFPGTYVAA
jgi:hypothetical protein